MNDTVYQAAALIIPLIFAIVFHEVSHGLVARMLGDPTAAEQKRLSLNPLRHVDPIGTVVLPGLLALFKMPVFGWAKPVPVIKQRLRNPRFGMMAVAAAGPGSNLIMAAISAVALGILTRQGGVPEGPGLEHFFYLNLGNFILINIFLALFNLLPIPPFDGSHIVEGLLPEGAARTYEKLRPFGFPLILILLVVLPRVIPGFDPIGSVLLGPFNWVAEQYLNLAAKVAGG